ncbi:hypothetical protein FVE85_3944 [Porphyridium purpureum]|uniref:Uncharacterized protein n=1 Tax=Porphyridium purpureum TaxID=35688 RepID=A0A5J4YR62_PORPP|nr:hypothetical protein FVE85_3944 [Porphyridium purpureum]|eukprot:POR2452..scf229_5
MSVATTHRVGLVGETHRMEETESKSGSSTPTWTQRLTSASSLKGLLPSSGSKKSIQSSSSQRSLVSSASLKVSKSKGDLTMPDRTVSAGDRHAQAEPVGASARSGRVAGSQTAPGQKEVASETDLGKHMKQAPSIRGPQVAGTKESVSDVNLGSKMKKVTVGVPAQQAKVELKPSSATVQSPAQARPPDQLPRMPSSDPTQNGSAMRALVKSVSNDAALTTPLKSSVEDGASRISQKSTPEALANAELAAAFDEDAPSRGGFDKKASKRASAVLPFLKSSKGSSSSRLSKRGSRDGSESASPRDHATAISKKGSIDSQLGKAFVRKASGDGPIGVQFDKPDLDKDVELEEIDVTGDSYFLRHSSKKNPIKEPPHLPYAPSGQDRDWVTNLEAMLHNGLRRVLQDTFYCLGSLSKRSFFITSDDIDDFLDYFDEVLWYLRILHNMKEEVHKFLRDKGMDDSSYPKAFRYHDRHATWNRAFKSFEEASDKYANGGSSLPPGEALKKLVEHFSLTCTALLNHIYGDENAMPRVLNAKCEQSDEKEIIKRCVAFIHGQKESSHRVFIFMTRWVEDRKGSFVLKMWNTENLSVGRLAENRKWRKEYQEARTEFKYSYSKTLHEYFKAWNEFEMGALNARPVSDR